MPGLAWQASLLDVGPVSVDLSFARLARRELDGDSWIEHQPAWVTGADALFADLLAQAPWEEQVVHMYDRRLAQPRLTARRWEGAPPVLEEMRAALSARYGTEFTSVGLNLYRDGRDSVAWHGDRVARTLPSALVAVVSLGEPRRFLLRPATGGTSLRLLPDKGDLLVMGGACQRLWRHSVPKARSAGPRISVTFRHAY